ncbi:MAG: GNAT family N-acetyltransferase [Rubricoccaceae bacterium]|nr:GNAT family N-acetyltransferase [Rubricoccaceae bacterium]
MHLRAARPDDAPALAALFADAVRAAGPARYSPPQVEAWAAAADHPRALWHRLLRHDTFVAEDETGPIGFAGLAPDGHVTALYVRPDRMRRGVGSALLDAVLARAETLGLGRLYAEASLFSLPLFERAGFTRSHVERIERRGVRFERHHVVRVAGEAGGVDGGVRNA